MHHESFLATKFSFLGKLNAKTEMLPITATQHFHWVQELNAPLCPADTSPAYRGRWLVC